jgi:hypothetical protein
MPNDQAQTKSAAAVASSDLLGRITPWPWYAHMLGGGKGGPNSYSITTNKEWGGEEGVTHLTIARVHGRPNWSAGWDAKLIAKAPELYEACKAANHLCLSLLACDGASEELIASIQAKLQAALES